MELFQFFAQVTERGKLSAFKSRKLSTLEEMQQNIFIKPENYMGWKWNFMIALGGVPSGGPKNA